jgi:hypothetical protein
MSNSKEDEAPRVGAFLCLCSSGATMKVFDSGSSDSSCIGTNNTTEVLTCSELTQHQREGNDDERFLRFVHQYFPRLTAF